MAQMKDAIPVNDVPKHVPGRPSIRTVWRWTEHGVKGVRLETFKVGHRRFTTPEAIERFCERVTQRADEAKAATVENRERELERLERELEAEGL